MRKQDVSKWKIALDSYRKLKLYYIEGEETDPGLKTNLQPLNEFRSSLDHIFRLIDLEITESENGESEELTDKINSEFKNLMSHIRRAFFDASDYLSINYRNKIVDILEPYSSEIIRVAIPDYYSHIYGKLTDLSEKIKQFRMGKGTQSDEQLFTDYINVIVELKCIFKKIQSCIPALEDLKLEYDTKQVLIVNKDKKYNRIMIASPVIAIAGIIIGTIVAIVF